ncbi:MAG: hypothetical protein JNK26_05215 [Candidatus Doudnabacteria bacterium]|nr:hypothetical protein [Candidatus Doudnabacteria bacterium]
MQPVIKKLDFGYFPDPNTTDLKDNITQHDGEVVLEFPLNHLVTKDLGETSRGRLTFSLVTKHVYGPPNDEGFYIHYKNIFDYPVLGFKVDELYEVTGLQNEFGKENAQLLNDPTNKHYIFFVKEGTFQCVAQSWKFELLSK